MAAVLLSDCTVLKNPVGEWTEYVILSPSTMDSADTIDVSDISRDGELFDVVAWDVESGVTATATYNTSTGVITIDAGGGTTNHTYSLGFKKVSYDITP